MFHAPLKATVFHERLSKMSVRMNHGVAII